jgi:16S rRNA (cytosine1402-N4)-methyltransferase
MGVAAMADLPSEKGTALPHRPVLLEEVRRALEPGPGQLFVDGTVGQGGHAAMLLAASAPDGRLLGLDRDPAALRSAGRRLKAFGARATLLHGDFRDLATLLPRWSPEPPPAVDGILVDLGIGSHQLEDPARGFSFRGEGPLDMRLDPGSGEPTAGELVNCLPFEELRDILRRFGEEPAASRVARAIVRARSEAPLTSTTELAEIVARSARRRRGREGLHPATKTFQALRIAVNRELEGLDRFLREATGLLRPGGRLAVISFHSLEDRIAKRTLRELASSCVCPPGLPVCACDKKALLHLPRKRAVRPSPEELLENPRARSARLRWGVRR